MSRRLLLCPLAIVLGVVACLPWRAPARPHVLVICIDALRADRLSPYGGSGGVAPHLEALAAGAVIFEHAYSVASWTKPAVASLLTGLYPSQHGLIASHSGRADLLTPKVVTLAERLRAAGYRTAAFVENVHLQRHYSGLDQGFEVYAEEAGSAADIANALVAWIARGDARPFFAYAHVLEPHWPYAPDADAIGAVRPLEARLGRLYWNLDGRRWPLLREAVNAGGLALDATDRAALEGLYDADVAQADNALGQMFEVLEARALLDETLVVVTADHGEAFLEHGRLDHGYGPYDELLRIPLIVRFPRAHEGGQRVAAPVQITDVAPTILDYLGLEGPRGGGRTLLPLVGGPSHGIARAVLAEEVHGAVTTSALRTKRYKYIAVKDEDAGGTTPVALLVPRDLHRGQRVRIRGIFASGAFVTDDVKLLARGDTDCELTGPIASVDGQTHAFALFGRSIDPSGAKTLPAGHISGTAEPFQSLEWVRVHALVGPDRLRVEKIERLARSAANEIELEGVLEAVRPGNGHLRLELCGYTVLIAENVRWKEFERARLTPAGEPRVSLAKPMTEQLYDLVRDPGEHTNVAEERTTVLASMRRRLLERRGRLAATAAGRGASVELGQHTRERLEALGYAH